MSNANIDLVTLDGLKERGAFVVAGFSRRFDDSNKHEIPKLWEKLGPNLPIKGQEGFETYGVEWGAGPSGFNYMAAIAIAPDANLPAGLERKNIPAQRYEVHRLTLTDGPLHDQMQAAVPEIWMKRVPNSRYRYTKGPDFEFYPVNFFPPGKGKVLEFWVPME